MQDDAGKTPESPRWPDAWVKRYGFTPRQESEDIRAYKHGFQDAEALADDYKEKVTHLEAALRGAEAKAAGYKQSVEYALDRFGAIGSMSDWTDSDLSDATQEARDAAGTLKRNVRLLEQPRAGEIR